MTAPRIPTLGATVAATSNILFGLAIFFAVILGATRLDAQETYEDLRGRFALDLPEGWEFAEERANVFQFSRGDGASVVLQYAPGKTDPAALLDYAMDLMVVGTLTDFDTDHVPPPGTTVKLTINGNPARWTEFELKGKNGNAMTAQVGAVSLVGNDAGIIFFAPSAVDLDEQAAATAEMFRTLRLPGMPVTGVTDEVAIDYAFADVSEANAGDTWTYTHDLITLTVPGNWSSSAGSGASITTLEHDDFGSLNILGKEGDDFGESAEAILEGMRAGTLSELGSVERTRGPYEMETDGGGSVLVEHYEAVVVAEGMELELGVILAALKDEDRGIGFLGLLWEPEEAAPAVLDMIRSAW